MLKTLGLGITVGCVAAVVSMAASQTFAAMPIQDPDHLLARVDAFVESGALEDAFHCNDQATNKRLNTDCRFGCSDSTPNSIGGCAVVCRPVQELLTRVVTTCGKESATIALGDGSELTLSADEFKDLNGNLLRLDLAMLDEFTGVQGYAKILSVTPGTYKLASGKEVAVQTIQGEIVVGKNFMEFDYMVARHVPAVSQILFKRIYGSKMFRVQDFARK